MQSSPDIILVGGRAFEMHRYSKSRRSIGEISRVDREREWILRRSIMARFRLEIEQRPGRSCRPIALTQEDSRDDLIISERDRVQAILPGRRIIDKAAQTSPYERGNYERSLSPSPNIAAGRPAKN